MLNHVAVVLPTRNRGKVLVNTLTSLISTQPLPQEIIVVDQSDAALRDDTRQTCQAIAEKIGWRCTVEVEGQPLAAPGQLRLVLSEKRGAARGRNTGANATQAELIFFTDDDSIVEPNWVAALAGAFEQPEVVGAYGRILRYRRANGIGVVRDNPNPHVFSEPTYPWYLGSGGNMAFRRSYLEQAGGMDDLLSIGAEFRASGDIDIGYRALAAFGGKIAYVPEALLYNNSTKTIQEQLHTEAGYGMGIGALVSKYWRCGSRGAAASILAKWIWQMAIRRTGAGLLKWRNYEIVWLAVLQLWWPFVGLWKARNQPVDREHWKYIASDGLHYNPQSNQAAQQPVETNS